MFCRSENRTSVKQSMSLVVLVAIWTNFVCVSSYAQELSRVPHENSSETISKLTLKSPDRSVANGSKKNLAPKEAMPRQRDRLDEAYGKLPLRFEINKGQTDSRVQFLARGSGYSLFLTPTESVMVLSRLCGPQSRVREARVEKSLRKSTRVDSVVRTKLIGARTQPDVTGLEELPGKSNYFIGNEPSKWQVGVSSYARVKYTDVYPGIDLFYYGNQARLEQDFVVGPGGEPRAIKLSFDSVRRLRIDGNGNLVLSVKGGELRQSKPIAYQVVEGQRREIASRYRLIAGNQIGFEVGAYDTGRPLVIDPVLSYSTYLGGGAADWGEGIATDSSGNAYVAGFTASTDFPLVNALQLANGGGSGTTDVFVTKLNSTGTALVYSTYLGGNWYDYGYAIAVDSSGSAYVTGTTGSSNFPLSNAFQSSLNSGTNDAFIAKLDPTGSALVYSTYFGGGGNDEGRGIAVDSSGSAYITGVAGNAIPTLNAFQPFRNSLNNAFVTKFNPTGTALVYSTYLGGSANDEGNAITVDASGDAYVTGYTESTNFPTVNALQPTKNGVGDAFVTKFDPTGMLPVYSTYLGIGGSNYGYGIAADTSGNAYVTGSTNSATFPTANALQQFYGGGSKDAFVTKYNPTGDTLVYSTYLGGSADEEGRGIALDSSGNAYVTGYTNSYDFPTVDSLPFSLSPMVFAAKLSQPGAALIYSTYLDGMSDDYGRGIAVDADGSAYITGFTSSSNFPTVGPLQQLRGSLDAFVTKIDGHPRYRISGHLLDAMGDGISAATVSLSGTQSGTTQTDANGLYTFFNLAQGGNFTVTPSQSPYTFVPTSQAFNGLSDNQTADFTVATYSISGNVTGSDNRPTSEAKASDRQVVCVI